VLSAPNSPIWIATALGVLASGGMLVPIDDLADAEQLEAALMSAALRLILTTAHHLDASGAILNAHDVTAIRVDEDGRSEPGATASQVLADKRAEDLPVPANAAERRLCPRISRAHSRRCPGSAASRSFAASR
jgi:long-subunit acyl-CoA synthetase (AMP-forming)